MRILYLSGSYIPSRRASSIQVMRMCAAFAGLGHEVTLVSKRCASRQEAGVVDDFSFYGVESRFTLLKIPRPAVRGGGLRYLWGIVRLTAGESAFDLYYCRDPLAAWLLVRRGLPVLYEAHTPPASRWARWISRDLLRAPTLSRVVLVSAALLDRFEALGLLPAGVDTVIAHDAADPLDIAASAPFNDRPARLGYVGHLYPGRGVELLLALAERLPRCELHVIGGNESDLARWRHRNRPPNLRYHGFVPPARLKELYGDLDVLLMPYQRRVGVASGQSDTSDWMSPLKLFEYMATGRAIVASDLPVLREVLEHERNALLVPPDDLEAWTGAVGLLLEDRALRRRLGETARREQRDSYTWEARARAVLESLAHDRR
jgi:glycosyltransferase involved in cell wall biosynthesis